MKRINLRVGTATAIGSLPHRNMDAAVALSLAACHDLPAAPSTPARNPREGMLAQAAWGLRGVEVAADGSLALVGPLDAADPFTDDALAGEAGIDGPAFDTMRTFLDANRSRTGPIKLQFTGPVTLGAALAEAGADPAVAFATAGRAVRARLGSILVQARALAPLAPLVVFLDEPGLVTLSAGLVTPSGRTVRLDAEHALDLVSGSLAAVEPYAVTGLHCCGQIDWELALGAGPQILSLPVHPSVLDHAGALGQHLDRGGWVAWGAVPTSRPIGGTVDPLWRSLSDTWCELVQRGCDALRLREQALVTPECGLAGFDPVQAEQILSLSAELAERVRRQSFGVRLSVGA